MHKIKVQGDYLFIAMGMPSQGTVIHVYHKTVFIYSFLVQHINAFCGGLLIANGNPQYGASAALTNLFKTTINTVSAKPKAKAKKDDEVVKEAKEVKETLGADTKALIDFILSSQGKAHGTGIYYFDKDNGPLSQYFGGISTKYKHFKNPNSGNMVGNYEIKYS